MTLFRCLVLLPLLAACAPPAPEVTRADGPTVIFEAGLGDDASVWNSVAVPSGLGRFAWTRAGYGLGAELAVGQFWPEDADGRRNGADVSTHLQAELDANGVEGPYILVGHSIGGLYVLDFARRHANQVQGIVLVDPRLPGFTARCTELALSGCEVPTLLRMTLSEAARIELDGVPETEAALADLSALSAIPITILLSTKPSIGEDPGWRAAWAQQAGDFAARFPHARVIPVQSGHYIQTTAPQAVSEAISALASRGQATFPSID